MCTGARAQLGPPKMSFSKMSVGDRPEQIGKEIGDAREVREMAGDDGVSGGRRSWGDSPIALQ